MVEISVRFLFSRRKWYCTKTPSVLCLFGCWCVIGRSWRALGCRKSLLLSPGRRFEMTGRGLKPPQLVCFSSSVHLFSKNFLMLCPARPMSELSSLNFSQLSNTRLTSMMNVSKFWYLKNTAKIQVGYCICISLLKVHETLKHFLERLQICMRCTLWTVLSF